MIAALAALLAAVTSTAGAQPAASDSVLAREVAPGVTHRRIVRPTGPWILNVLEVDLRRPELAIRAARACDALYGRERPSAIAKRLRSEGIEVVGVLNADFFDLRGGTGVNENNLVLDGELVKGVRVTESPFDAFDNVHSQFGITSAGKPVLDRYRLGGTVRTRVRSWPLGALNGAPVSDAMTLWTHWSYGRAFDSIPSDSLARATLSLVATHGDTTLYEVRPLSDPPVHGPREAILIGKGSTRSPIATLRAGERVVIVAALDPRPGDLRTLVGGWPRVVRQGRSVAAEADSLEGTIPRFARQRHPRSAVGISRDSLTLYLVAVDGRHARSVGMSLEELADAMIGLGAHEALNLDGGGSTALVVGDSVVNTPSDASGERPVGNVLIVTRHAAGKGAGKRAVPAMAGTPSTCVLSGGPDPDAGKPPR